jgi:hypothetical protein
MPLKTGTNEYGITTLSTSITGPATLCFAAMVEDTLMQIGVCIDGVPTTCISAWMISDCGRWANYTLNIPAGTHSLKFEFDSYYFLPPAYIDTFNTNLAAGLDKFTLRSTPILNAHLDPSTRNVGLRLGQLSGHGDIVIQVSTNLINWEPVLTNAPTSGTLQLSFPLGQGTRYFRAVEK